nr:reverse transcriptase domain-containing protein [Tanacetum cinerariifolium]
MADDRTMAELLQAPTEGYEDAIVIPEIAANNFELKYGQINLVQNKQFFGHDKEDPHAHIHYFNKITSTMRVPNVPSSSIKLMLFPFSLEGAAQIWLKKEAPRSILTWEYLVSKFINHFFPPSKTTNLRNEITRYQQRFDESFYEAWERFNDLLRACDFSGCINSTHSIMPSPASSSTPTSVKAVEPNCVTCDGTHSYQNCPATSGNIYRDNIQETFTPELTLTCMTLELVDRSVSKPISIAKDVSVKVGVFHFPADFVVVDFKLDPQVPLILRRCFLKVSRSLIDVHKGELTLRIGNKAITYNLNQTSSGNPTPYDDPIVSTTSPTLTPFGDSDFLLFKEADAFLSLKDDPNSPEFNPFYYDPEGDILLLEAILNSEPLPPLLNHEQYLPSFKKELKVCQAKTVKSSIDEPPEVELKDLPPHLEYAFLEGDNKLPVIIAKELGDEEKSALINVLKSHKRAIAWKLSDIQGINPEFYTHKILMEEDYKPAVQHQRRVNPKIHNVIKKEVMLKYGVTHRLSTAYHPQTSGQVEVSNRGLKRILKRTIGENYASWSDKLDDALWAFRTAYKTPIGCTPYKLVYGKACHIPIKLEHKAYWALKQANFDLAVAGDHRKVQLNELNELHDHAYENSLIYNEKTKRIHDSKIKNRVFNVGDRVLLSNSRLKIFSGKLKTHWSGPFTIAKVFPYGTVELSQANGPNFKVNGHRVKHYFGGNVPQLVVPDLQTFPMDN